MRMSFKQILMTVALSALTISAFANFQCRVHNARSQYFVGIGPTRAVALGSAMRLCSARSTYAANCVVDYCGGVTGGGPATPAGTWSCTMTNARGQSWYGTGPTRAIAASNAARFCSSHSTYASNCVIQGCSFR